jgi:hypothetical protein
VPQVQPAGATSGAVPGSFSLQPHASQRAAAPHTAWGEPVVGQPVGWPPAGGRTVAELQANLLASPDNRQLHKKQRTSMEGLPVPAGVQQQHQYQQQQAAPVHPPRPSNIPAIRIPTEPGDAAAAVPSHVTHRHAIPDPSAPMPLHQDMPRGGVVDEADGGSDIFMMEQAARQQSRHGMDDSDEEAQQRITLSGGMDDALQGLTRYGNQCIALSPPSYCHLMCNCRWCTWLGTIGQCSAAMALWSSCLLFMEGNHTHCLWTW